MNNALVVINETTGVPTTTSLMVAEVFGKLHKHVLRDITALECSAAFFQSNFGLIEVPVKVASGYATIKPTA